MIIIHEVDLQKTILFISVFTGLVLFSCKQGINNTKSNLHYSISLGTFKNYNDASEFRFNFSNEIRAKIRYELISSKKYKVLIGNYESSYDAGETAFNLYLENKIDKYEIVKDGQNVLDEFINVPFVSFYLGKSSIYNYNLITKIKELLLSFENKDVASISLTRKSDKIFITSIEKSSYEKQIKNVELFLFKRDNDELKKLIIQKNINTIYTYWDNPDTFKLNLIKVDDKNPQKVLQKIYALDSEGNEKYYKENHFDLLLQGYPVINKKRINFFSSNNKFQIKIKSDDIYKNIYLYDYESRSETFITLTSNNIYDLKWSNDNKLAFIITKAEFKDNYNDELFVIDISNKTIIKKFLGNEFDNLLVKGNFLFFDEIKNKINCIHVYNLKENADYDLINSYGGCNLFNYPKVLK